MNRTDSGVVVLWPRGTLRHLPYMARLIIAVNVGLSLLILLFSRDQWPWILVMVAVSMINVAIWTLPRTQWRIEGGRLSMRRPPFKRQWAPQSVVEIKRAPGNDGFLVRVRGKGYEESLCPAGQDVLEFTAAILNRELGAPTAPAA